MSGQLKAGHVKLGSGGSRTGAEWRSLPPPPGDSKQRGGVRSSHKPFGGICASGGFG